MIHLNIHYKLICTGCPYFIKWPTVFVRAEVKGHVCEMQPAGFQSRWKLIRLAAVNEMCCTTTATEALLGINSMSSSWSCFHTVECDPGWRSRTVWNSALLTHACSAVGRWVQRRLPSSIAAARLEWILTCQQKQNFKACAAENV